ncbi:IS1634 family transposase [Olsenella sp. Marseille-P4559]|uniref:IS1634 family transposase n=1 Tax=Olsenella sp. Marseille-P4559 TaxID=2364795 RepID=UPI0013EF01A3|nr:IS1634 family transposase [Olsenella sp. Marseille-P4559]
MGIEGTLRNHVRGRGIGYDLNAVMRLLVAERIAEPGSKHAAWDSRERRFFRSDFTGDDLHRALGELARAKDKVVSSMNKRVAEANMRDMSCVYHDVTNYCFESDAQDGPRGRGVPKEMGKGPIVQMGPLQDERGIPICHRKLAGNTPDAQTMIPVLSDLKRDYGIGRVIAVADKGLSCSGDIAAAVARGDGFVFSQSARGTKSDRALKKWLLDERGFRHVGEDFKIKGKQGFKTCHIKAEDAGDGHARDVEMPVRYVGFWSRKYEERARHDRAKVIERARGLIENPAAFSAHEAHGAAKYVRNLHFDRETGEIVSTHRLSLNEEAMAEAGALDGYCLVVTGECGWADEKVLDACRELWRIEQSFEITKPELRARPIYVWKDAHMEAHFLTCFVALAILRILQCRTGIPAARIRDEMAGMSATNFDSNWWVFDHRTDESDALADALGLPEPKRKFLTTREAKQVLAKANRAKLPHRQ